MPHILTFNKENPILLTDNKHIQDLQILINEFDSYRHNFIDIIGALGDIALTYKTDNGFSFNLTFKKTFKTHADFLSACTLLRPFLLQDEVYYARSNSLIRTALRIVEPNNSLLKKILIS